LVTIQEICIQRAPKHQPPTFPEPAPARNHVDSDGAVVHAAGDVDMLGVPILTEQLAAAVKAAAGHDKRLIVIDLRDVSFFGSIGLAALVACRDDCARWNIAVRVVASNTAVLPSPASYRSGGR